MTTNNHPITPPPELYKQWEGQARSLAFEAAYQAGADMELEACCQWLNTYGHTYQVGLRAARRPKPPSLKEQALKLLEPEGTPARLLNEDQMGIIRSALETLPQ